MFVFRKIWRALFSWNPFRDSLFCLIFDDKYCLIPHIWNKPIRANVFSLHPLEILENHCYKIRGYKMVAFAKKRLKFSFMVPKECKTYLTKMYLASNCFINGLNRRISTLSISCTWLKTAGNNSLHMYKSRSCK